MKTNTKISIEYSALLGLFWAINGIVFNFAAVYLQYRGYTNYSIGVILTFANITGFAVQPFIAGYIDRRNKKPLLTVILLLTLISALVSALAFLTDGDGFIQAAAYAVLLACSILTLPFTNSASTYICTWGYDIRFPRSRSMGSLCFAFGMLAVGVLCERLSPLSVSAVAAVLSLLMAAVTALLMYQDRTARLCPPHVFDNKTKAANPIGVFIRDNKRFCVYLIGVMFLFVSHGISNNFFIEFLKPLGGDSKDMGRIFCVMALSEMPAMLFFDRIMRKTRCSTLLVFSALMFTLKAFAYLIASSIPMMYAAACLQSVSFAILIPASVRYVELVIKKRDSVKGQSFTTGMFTLGCVLASYFGGLTLDSAGLRPTLILGLMATLAGTVFVVLGVRKTGHT